jgi:hypothetical protein
MAVTARLHVDGKGTGWALVRCDQCKEVHRYIAAEASHDTITCKCGAVMDVREKIMEEVEENTEAAHELHRQVTGEEPCLPTKK